MQRIAVHEPGRRLIGPEWSPVKQLDLGIEYRHAQREVASGLKWPEMAAAFTFKGGADGDNI
jgi:hypothetical protein